MTLTISKNWKSIPIVCEGVSRDVTCEFTCDVIFQKFFHYKNWQPYRYTSYYIIIEDRPRTTRPVPRTPEQSIDVVTMTPWLIFLIKIYPLPPTDSFPYHVIVLKRKCLELGIVSRELNFYFRSQAPFWSYPQPLENFSGPQPSSPPLDPPWPSSLDSPSMLPLSFLVSLNFSHAKSHANQNRNNDHSVNQFLFVFFQQPFVYFTHFLVVCTP